MKYEDLDRSPAYQLWQASNAWQRLMRRALDPVGLTHVQFVLLASVDILAQQEPVVTQAQVARFASMDENMTSQVLRGLADRGLVLRESHPTDARARQLHLSGEGQELLREAREKLGPMKESFFSVLGDRAEVLAQLLAEISKTDDFDCG